MAFVFTVLSQLVHAQSGSFGSTFVHTGMEMGILGQHNFLTGSGTINAGIVGSERQPVIGVYSFVNPGGSWINASNTAFMDGYVRTYNSGPFSFPIGDNNKYRPAAVSASSATAPTTAAYYGVDPGLATTSDLKGGNYGILPVGSSFPTTAKASGVGTVDNVEYWDIDGTTPARITLTWDATTPISTMVGGNLSNLTIVGWNGTQWVVIPSTVDAGSLLQVTSASAFTGPAGTVSTGSITTNATLIPGSFTVYTLAGNCPPTTITPSLTSTTICSGDQVSINYTTTPAGEQTLWTRMPGNLSSLGNVTDFPTASTTTATSYTYTASITSFGCPSQTAVTTVTVNPVPVITPSICSQTICSGETGAITFVSSIPGSTINWLRVEDGLTGTGDISSLFANAGNFTYKIWGVSSAPASCPSSTTITCTIVVNNCCTLLVSASASQTAVCVGQAVTLATAISGNVGPVTYAWTGPNGFVSTLANPTLPAATSLTSGTYTVTVTDPTASASCVRTASVMLNVGSLYVGASSNSPVCTSGSLSLTGVAAGGSGSYTYGWSGPNGFVSAVQNPTVALSTTAQSGNYLLTVTDTQGCSGTATTSVIVATQPNLTVTGSPSQTICSGQSTTLNVAGSNGAPVSWTNSVGQTGTGTAISSGTLVNAGTVPMVVIYRIVASTGSCSDEEIVQVVVRPEPRLQVTPVASVICNLEQTSITATANPATASINWTRTPNTPNPPAASGSGTGSVTINQVLPPATYTYTFTATNGGCSSTLPATVAITVQQ